MNIAVIGAGYAGLAVTWHLLQKNFSVTVFDKGSGASHASTGLLHKAPGKKGQLTWRAEEGMSATKELLNVAGPETFVENSILRVAANEEQRELFGSEPVLIEDGITVFSQKYLENLKKRCRLARFIDARIESLDDVKEFDRIIITTGAEILDWFNLPLKKNIGQCLVCRSSTPLSTSILSQGHITLTKEPGVYLVGSTYEYTPKPDPKKAMNLINQVSRFYPEAKNFKVLDILSGTQ